MPDPTSSNFIEIAEFWLSITRREVPARGFGKWMLYTEQPHHLYGILREGLISGALPSASSIKTKNQPPAGMGAVYVYSAPYTDREKILRLAEELRELNEKHPLELAGPLLFKTDLHNTWCETLSRPGDGYHELLKKQNYLYKYQEGKLIVNAVIWGLHLALEDPPQNADPEFLIIRSMLPEELFTKEVRSKS